MICRRHTLASFLKGQVVLRRPCLDCGLVTLCVDVEEPEPGNVRWSVHCILPGHVGNITVLVSEHLS
jgi:hypothetical protein